LIIHGERAPHESVGVNVWIEEAEDLSVRPGLAPRNQLSELAQPPLNELVGTHVWVEEEEQVAVPGLTPPTSSARMTPDEKLKSDRRFTLIVEGADAGDLLHAWSEMCQTGGQPSPEFEAVFPYLTSMAGCRFRFRGGDPDDIRTNLERLLRNRFERLLGTQFSSSSLRLRIEEQSTGA